MSDKMRFRIKIKPLLGDKHCGDRYFIKEFDEGKGETKTLIAVIDGLGHGVWAEEAAKKACEYLESNYHLDLSVIFHGCNQFLRYTVGVAMGIAVIDYERSNLTFAGIGNVELRIIADKCFGMVSDEWIVGAGFKKIHEESCTFKPDNLLIMHSDGISAKFDFFSFPTEVRADPEKLAEAISRDFASDNDDSIVVVGKGEKE